jgi:hypothetical protein
MARDIVVWEISMLRKKIKKLKKTEKKNFFHR